MTRSSLESQRWSITLLRVVVGIVFVMHGGQKWFAWGPHDTAANFTRMHVPLPMISALLTMAAELLCGLALIVGLFTRIATIPLMIVMTVALLFVHIRNGFFLPVGCEYVLVLLVALIAIRTLGPGEASMDNSVGGRRR